MRFAVIISVAAVFLTGAALHAQEHRDTLVVVHRDTVWYVPSHLQHRMRRDGYFRNEKALARPVAAVRTNLLLPFLNAGAEWPLSDRWSLGLDAYWPWVPRQLFDRRFEDRRYCIQGLGGFLEARFYPGSMHAPLPGREKYRLLGHSLAFVAGAAYYDCEIDWQGQQGELYAVGLGYCYSLPLGRRTLTHLEFDLTLGVVYHVSHPYAVHSEGGYLIREKDRQNQSVYSREQWLWGVPIRVGVSLAVPFRTTLPLRRREGASR